MPDVPVQTAPDRDDVVTGLFADVDAPTREAIAAQGQSVAAFLRDDVGRAISFSIDTEDDLRRRCRIIGAIG